MIDREPMEAPWGRPGTPPAQSRIPILLFAKRPRAGHTKTRLGAEIGAERAARFAAAFLRDSLKRLLDWGGAPLWLLGDHDDPREFDEFASPGVLYRPQGEGDLGARLRRAVEYAFRSGCEGIVALGADTPHLPLRLVEAAVAAVRQGEVTIGPSRDGGYYTLGVPASFESLDVLFEGIDWGSSTVLRSTRKALRGKGFRWRELEPFWDIDEVSDLVQWQQELARGRLSDGPGTESQRLLRTLATENE